MKSQKLLLLVALFLTLSPLTAQSGGTTDTLEQARALAYAKDFDGADQLLSLYTAQHPDIDAMRFHAQVLFWKKDFAGAEAVYGKALAAFPDQPVIKLDFGQMLYNMGKLGEARKLLGDYLQDQPEDQDVHLLMAYMDHWEGREEQAAERAKWLLSKNPENNSAQMILEEIESLTATYVQTSSSYTTDDQTLSTSAIEVESGSYESPLLAPVVKLRVDNSVVGGASHNSFWLQGANKFFF